jgi:CRP-like cAMP-binding protein
VLRIVSGNTVYETVRQGSIVGEMGIVEPGARRSASVIAGTRAELMKIDRAKFLALVANTPDFSLEVMQVMARRIRVTNQGGIGAIIAEFCTAALSGSGASTLCDMIVDRLAPRDRGRQNLRSLGKTKAETPDPFVEGIFRGV